MELFLSCWTQSWPEIFPNQAKLSDQVSSDLADKAPHDEETKSADNTQSTLFDVY